jgi:hypothetical protein
MKAFVGLNLMSDDLIDATGNSHTVPTNKRPDTFSLSWRYGEIYQD